jgi:hypothetical protein
MTLEGEMAQVLADMTLLSYGSTTSWSSSGGGDGPEKPSGDSSPLAEHWLAEWERDPSHETVERARAELASVRRRQAPASGDDSTLDDWVLKDGEGFAVEQVAGKFRIAAARVRRIRLKAGRESEFGQVVDVAAARDSSEERVAYLDGRGCSWREIAAQTGLHKTQVQRILARRRNAA